MGKTLPTQFYRGLPFPLIIAIRAQHDTIASTRQLLYEMDHCSDPLDPIQIGLLYLVGVLICANAVFHLIQ